MEIPMRKKVINRFNEKSQNESSEVRNRVADCLILVIMPILAIYMAGFMKVSDETPKITD